MKAAIYARVSDGRHQDASNQLAQLKNYADAKHWTVVSEYVDGDSGAKADRPALQKLFDAASRREFDVVLVWALDRFTRQGVAQTFEYIKNLKTFGVEFEPFYQEDGITILQGDCREILPTLPDQSVNCCVTSPPYWGLRDYGVAGQLGLETTPEEYVSRMVEVFREVRRVLRDDGTLWLNMGDSYANDGKWGGETGGKQFYLGEANRRRIGREKRVTQLKPKDLIGIPWRMAFALQADGWYLRSDIIWSKPNPMPESVTDRPTKAHEYLFLLSKSERYYYDAAAIREPVTGGPHPRGDGINPKAAKWPNAWSAEPGRHDGIGNGRFRPKQNESFSGSVNGLVDSRNKRSVWTVPTEAYPEAHFATFPTALIEPCIKAGCPAAGTVFDPFGGSGTTMQVARALGCRGLMIELNRDYCRMAAKRLRQGVLPLTAAQ